MKKNEDLLQGFGNIDAAYVEEARVKKPERSFSLKIASLVACIAVFLGSLAVYMFIPYGDPVARYSGDEYYEIIKSIDSLDSRERYNNRFEALTAHIGKSVKDLGFSAIGGVNYDADMFPGDAPTSDNIEDSVGNGEYVETTDNQVAGVIEADLFKRTSTHIFYLDGTQLHCYSIDKENSTRVGGIEIKLPEDLFYTLGGTAEMYLSQDASRVTVIYPYVNSNKEYAVSVISLDVSSPESPTQTATVSLSGSYLSSRVENGRLLMFTSFLVNNADFSSPETFVPTVTQDGKAECISPDNIIIPERPSAKRYTVVTALDESTMEELGTLALFSYAETVYVSESSIYAVGMPYIGDGDGTQRTDITRIDYSEGTLTHAKTYTVEGSVLNQYSIDEHEGVLRAVTTTFMGGSSASLFCIDKESGDVIGQVMNFAPRGEEVTSVRFDGDSAYVCTAVIVTFTDPVFFFDLSDYANITYTDTGYIDGFSSSLINYGDGVLLGIGEEDRSTLKVETYAEVEGEVISLDSYTLFGEASEIYKSYLVNREECLFGFGVHMYDPDDLETPYRYVLLKIENGALSEIVNVPVFADPSVMRAVYIDGYLYILGANDFRVEKIEN